MSMGCFIGFWRRILHGSKSASTIRAFWNIRSLRPDTITDWSTLQAIGGAVWHGVKGYRNSPYGERRIGALTAIKARAPVLGGNFGVWGGMFSTYDCAVKGIRKKEDPYNAIIAGFLTGGSLAIRGGFRAARNSAIMCAIFLAVIEGVGIGFQRAMADNTNLNVSSIAHPQIYPC